MSTQLFVTLSAVFVLFAINSYVTYGASTVLTYGYNVTVKTSSTKFDDHNGNLKLSILYKNAKNKGKQEDFVLTSTDVNIAPNRNYTSMISSFAPLGNITSVYLRWTLSSPYNPIYAIKKPKIYFDPVVLSYSFVDPNLHMKITQNRKFCTPTTPVAIKHSDGASFYPCT